MAQIIKCPKCGNVWTYKGSKLMATCSSCSAKVRVDTNLYDQHATEEEVKKDEKIL